MKLYLFTGLPALLLFYDDNDYAWYINEDGTLTSMSQDVGMDIEL